MENTEIKRERAVLAGLSAASMDESERSTEISMEELAALVDTAGGDTVAIIMQSRPTPDPRSFIGDGKVREMKELIAMNDCDLAVFDNELTPSQMRVLSEELGVKVLDRSGLILDIFAQRAQTREGQLQVELAQYKYLLPAPDRYGGRTLCARPHPAAPRLSAPAAPAKPSLRPTAATSAARYRSSRRSWPRCARSEAHSAAAARRTTCPSSRSSATRMPVNRRF